MQLNFDVVVTIPPSLLARADEVIQ